MSEFGIGKRVRIKQDSAEEHAGKTGTIIGKGHKLIAKSKERIKPINYTNPPSWQVNIDSNGTEEIFEKDLEITE